MASTSSRVLFRAIVARWRSESQLTTRFADRFTRDRAKSKEPALPYAVYESILSIKRSMTNQSEYWEHVIRFKVFDRTVELAEEGLDLVGEVLDGWQPEDLVFPPNSGGMVSWGRVGESFPESEDQRRSENWIEFKAIRYKPRR